MAEVKPKYKVVDKASKGASELTFAGAVKELFFTHSRFVIHRTSGLLYLIQFAASVLLMTFDYELYKKTPLMWTLPLNGWLQAVIAMNTFTFLPNGRDAQGAFRFVFTFMAAIRRAGQRCTALVSSRLVHSAKAALGRSGN